MKQTKWWFVVSGQECSLTSLENEWESVTEIGPVKAGTSADPIFQPATHDSECSGERHIISDVSPYC